MSRVVFSDDVPQETTLVTMALWNAAATVGLSVLFALPALYAVVLCYRNHSRPGGFALALVVVAATALSTALVFVR